MDERKRHDEPGIGRLAATNRDRSSDGVPSWGGAQFGCSIVQHSDHVQLSQSQPSTPRRNEPTPSRPDLAASTMQGQAAGGAGHAWLFRGAGAMHVCRLHTLRAAYGTPHYPARILNSRMIDTSVPSAQTCPIMCHDLLSGQTSVSPRPCASPSTWSARSLPRR